MTITALKGQLLSAHVLQALLIEQLTPKVSTSRKRKPMPHQNLTASLVWAAVIVLTHVALGQTATLDIYKNARLGHRIVQTRYGRLHGLILPLDNFRFLRAVEVFLGVPYATPPTKQNR